MKVVAFFGSPRIGGNTDLMLREALRAQSKALRIRSGQI